MGSSGECFTIRIGIRPAQGMVTSRGCSLVPFVPSTKLAPFATPSWIAPKGIEGNLCESNVNSIPARQSLQNQPSPSDAGLAWHLRQNSLFHTYSSLVLQPGHGDDALGIIRHFHRVGTARSQCSSRQTVSRRGA